MMYFLVKNNQFKSKLQFTPKQNLQQRFDFFNEIFYKILK